MNPEVARAIGWQLCGRCGKHWNRDDDFGSEVPVEVGYQVDDLLAWLEARFGEKPDIGDNGDDWWVDHSEFDEWSENYRSVAQGAAPTLLAALELAVLSVKS